MAEILQENQTLIYWLAGGSLGLLVLGVLLVPVIVARIPDDYFVRGPDSATASHSLIRFVTRIVKNLLGVVLLVAGILMLLLPGQGILTIFAALMLLEFPGKRRLELFIIRQPVVLKAVQWLRRRAHREPLLVPRDADGP